MRLTDEKGLLPHSELFICSPSVFARKLYYCLYRAGHYYCTPQYSISRDSYPCHLLLYVKEGSLEWKTGHHSAILGKNEFALIDCRIPHAYRASGPAEFLWIHFRGSNSDDFAEVSQNLCGGHFIPAHPDYCASVLEKLIDSLSHTGIMTEAETSLQLHRLLTSLVDENSRSISHPVVSAVRAYFLLHLSEQCLLEDVAEQVHISTSQLTRIFRAAADMTPHEYLISLRIEYAKALLQETSFSIDEISARVGYVHATSFETAFRRRVGLSPARYRNTVS